MIAHDKTVQELYSELNSRLEGLTTEEVIHRQQLHGKNVLPASERINLLHLFFSQFTELLVLILIAAAIISAFIGFFEDHESLIDALAIVLVVLLNAVLGFYQEYSAEKTVAALKKFTVSEVVVSRNRSKAKITAEELVPGDIVFLEAGNTVPADIRIVQGYELRTSEAILTGESLSIKKRNQVLSVETPLADRINMLYKGTTVVNGSGQGIVVNTGIETELGKIASSLAEIRADETPLQAKLARLAKQLTAGVVFLSIVIFVIGLLFLRTSPTELFIFSIGLAVAAVPEGLPAVLTLSLAIGITRMARKNALIRKLPAVEVLGSATVICTDKTGTLTKNEMTVKLLWTSDCLYNFTGTGYANNGEVVNARTGHLAVLSTDKCLELALETCVLANEASIEFQEPKKPFKVFGDPTEIALLVAGAKAGITAENLEEQWHKEIIFPFDSERKRMSTIYKDKETGECRVFVKGASDILLDLCTNKWIKDGVKPLTEQDKEIIRGTAESYSTNYAYRILGLAYREASSEAASKICLTESYEHAERNLTFIGLIAMIDPPREQSAPSIEQAREAGINVIMITGDHVATAKAIGRSINLVQKEDPDPLTGVQLDKMSDEELEQQLDSRNIFARVNPSHKLGIVTALKKKKQIVVMTGDGVNDAPALKRADIGVAMGITGTDVAKEVSSMILIDDDFSTIVEAIAEGRAIYDNIKKFIAFLLSANAGEILAVLLGIILGVILQTPILPLIAVQLLYINLVTDTFPALALGVDTPEEDIMRRKPRDPDEPLLDKNLLSMIAVAGAVFAIGAITCFFAAVNFDHTALTAETEIKAQTMAFTALVIYQLFHAINTSEKGTIFSMNAVKNRALFAAILLGFLLQLVAVYVPFLQPFLGTTALEISDWLIILVTAIPVVVVEELRKKIIVE
ncbi:MAG: cation-translocating P-type ATPase [Candidatus Odinarchaeota archaeon]